MRKTKRCTKCGEVYPLTAEYWYQCKNGKGGIRYRCRECEKERRRQYYQSNREKVLESQRLYYEENSDKVKDRVQQWRTDNASKVRERRQRYQEENADKISESRHRYYQKNADRIREKSRRYRKNNPDKVREGKRRHYEANRDKILESKRKYREKNADKIRLRKRKYYEANRQSIYNRVYEWRKANPDKVHDYESKWYEANPNKQREYTSRYRARKLDLPDTLTADDWQYALTYFNGCCAVCGRQLNDLFGEHTAAMDHWIPLSSDDCPGTIPENIIPLCHGVGGCNNSKSAKDPETWLIETYGARKARQIMARIQAYFDSLGDDEDVA